MVFSLCDREPGVVHGLATVMKVHGSSMTGGSDECFFWDALKRRHGVAKCINFRIIHSTVIRP